MVRRREQKKKYRNTQRETDRDTKNGETGVRWEIENGERKRTEKEKIEITHTHRKTERDTKKGDCKHELRPEIENGE